MPGEDKFNSILKFLSEISSTSPEDHKKTALSYLNHTTENYIQIASQDPTFQEKIIKELCHLLTKVNPSLRDDSNQKIRQRTVELMKQIVTLYPPRSANPKELYFNMMDRLIEVLERDNENNGQVAVRTLWDIMKTLKQNNLGGSELNERMQKVVDYIEKLFNEIPKNIEKIKQEPSDNERELVPATQSLKCVMYSCHIIMTFTGPDSAKQLKTISSALLKAYLATPPNFMPQVKNLPLFIQYIEIQRVLVSLVTSCIRQSYQTQTDCFIGLLPDLISGFFTILENFPPEVGTMRKDFLYFAKTMISFCELQQQQALRWSPDDIEKRKPAVYQFKLKLAQLFDKFMNLNLLFGESKGNNDLASIGNNLINQYLQQRISETSNTKNRDPSLAMSMDQQQRGHDILIQRCLDPKLTNTSASQLVYTIFNFQSLMQAEFNQKEEYEKIIKLFFQLLEFLVAFHKESLAKLKLIRSKLKKRELDKQGTKKQNQEKPFEKMNFQGDWLKDRFQRDLDEAELFALNDPIEHAFTLSDSKFIINSGFQAFQEELFEQFNNQNQVKELKTLLTILHYSFTSTFKVIDKMKENPERPYTPMQGMAKLKFLKLLKKLFLTWLDIFQFLDENQDPKIAPKRKDQTKNDMAIKELCTVMNCLPSDIFRELIESVGEKLYDCLVKAKTIGPEQACVKFIDFYMKNSSQDNQPKEEHISIMLETFFDYLTRHIQNLGRPIPEYHPLSKIPAREAQETIMLLISNIVEYSVSKVFKNNAQKAVKCKHMLFSVFIFCIKHMQYSEVIHHYLQIMRNMFKSVSTIGDANLLKDFLPMIQGLLQTFLQAKEEAAFIKETNEICQIVPARLKSLIEYLPIISKPLIDSMRSTSIELIESGINTIQLWVSALAQYPEILSPVLAPILPELNVLLYKFVHILPNVSVKLLGKLGAKSRPYNEDKEFRFKNFPEDGLKLELTEKCSDQTVILGLDSAIDVVMIKIIDQCHKYSEQKLIEAFKMIKAAFLTHVNMHMDIEYMIACVINKGLEMPQDHLFLNKLKKVPRVSQYSSGTEMHGFEKILKGLYVACSIPSDDTRTQKLFQKVNKFMKFVAELHALIYISQNGRLQQGEPNELNSLGFIENCMDFLFYNLNNPGVAKGLHRSYQNGSEMALKSLLEFLNKLYKGQEEKLAELEIIQILIDKLCQHSSSADVQKKIAASIALRIVFDLLPKKTLEVHAVKLVKKLLFKLELQNEKLLFQIESETERTWRKLFSKIDLKGELRQQILEILIPYLYSMRPAAREGALIMLAYFQKVEKLSAAQIIRNLKVTQIQGFQGRTYDDYLVNEIILKRAQSIYALTKSGHTALLKLIGYADFVKFMVKEGLINMNEHRTNFLSISDQLLAILQDENDIFEKNIRDRDQNFQQTAFQNQQNTFSSIKYEELEQEAVRYNQPSDAFRHSQQQHQVKRKEHFEKEAIQKTFEAEKAISKYQFVDFKILEQKKIQDEDELRRIEAITTEARNREIKENFQANKRPKIFNYDYFRHYYEIYPNHKTHTELFCSCLSLLTEILTERQMRSWFREKMTAYQDLTTAIATPPPSEGPPLPPIDIFGRYAEKLNNHLDFKAVEIRSKMITIVFKAYQREENNIMKMALKCLKQILKTSPNQQEALPNYILKECVRPELNIIGNRQVTAAQFKQLKLLIKVLYQNFNDHLARHLQRTLTSTIKTVEETYKSVTVENPTEEQKNELVKKIVMEYNDKVENLEIANQIIEILFLLLTDHTPMPQISESIFQLETAAQETLRKGLREQFQKLGIQSPHQNENNIRPLNIKVGMLSSQLREGLLKYCNKNSFSGYWILHNACIQEDHPGKQQMILDFCKRKESYSLRERISREASFIKELLERNQRGTENGFVLGLELVNVFIKRNPNYMNQYNNFQLVKDMVQLWKKYVPLREPPPGVSAAQFQRQMKIIQNSLITFCRNYNLMDMRILPELLKPMKEQCFADVTPLQRFFLYEVPSFLPAESLSKLINYVLIDKTDQQMDAAAYEGKFQCIVYLVQPALYHAAFKMEKKEDAALILSLQNAKNFLLNLVSQKTIKEVQRLSNQQTLSPYTYFAEVVKCICILLLKVEDFASQCARSKDLEKELRNFIKSVGQQSQQVMLKEWSYYALGLIEEQKEERSDEAKRLLFKSAVSLIQVQNFECKALLHKTLKCYINAMEKQGNFNEFAKFFTTTFAIEGHNSATYLHLSSIIAAQGDKLLPYFKDYAQFMLQAGRKMLEQKMSLQQKNLGLDIIKHVFSWIQYAGELVEQNKMGKDEYAHFKDRLLNTKLIETLYSFNSHTLQSQMKQPERETEFRTECLYLLVQALKMKQTIMPSFQILEALEQRNQLNISQLTQAMITNNAMYIFGKYFKPRQEQVFEQKQFFLNYLKILQQYQNYKMTVLSIKVALLLLTTNLDDLNAEQKQQLKQKFYPLIVTEFKKCMATEVIKKVKEQEEQYLQKKKMLITQGRMQASDTLPEVLQVQEALYNVIPHFTVRCLYGLVNRKWLAEEVNDAAYTEVMNIIYKAVYQFRQYFTGDREIKDNWLGEAIKGDEDIINLSIEDTPYEAFNQESIIIGLKVCAHQVKRMKKQAATTILEQIQHIFVAFGKYNSSKNLIRGLLDVTKILIESNCENNLSIELKTNIVSKMTQRMSDLAETKKEEYNDLIGDIFDMALDFLDQQSLLNTDMNMKLFDRLFIYAKNKSASLKRKFFRLFEKHYGSSLYAKINYYFSRLILEDSEKTNCLYDLNMFLELLMFNFRVDVPLAKQQCSAQLPVLFPQTSLIVGDFKPSETEEGKQIKEVISGIAGKLQKYSKLSLDYLMEPLSDSLININPQHSNEKQINDKLIQKLLWQIWRLLNPNQKQTFADMLNRFLLRAISQIQTAEQNSKRLTIPKIFLEALCSFDPMPKIHPEVLQYLAKSLNLWHVALPVLESQVTLFPESERHVHALQEIYQKLVEDDYLAGLRRIKLQNPETRSVISLGQHQMWEDVFQQGEEYIDYFAEQEGLYQWFDEQLKDHQKRMEQMPGDKRAHVSTEFMSRSDQPQVSSDSRPKEMRLRDQDLLVWQDLFIDSLRMLSKWDLFKSISGQSRNQSMQAEYLWSEKDVKLLQIVKTQHNSTKYQLYNTFMIIQGEKNEAQYSFFDENFRKTINLAYKDWDQNLPSYVDQIQFENLIMFQLAIESSEGGRNMIRDARNPRGDAEKWLAEIKAAVNIWRDRLPNEYESISVWKDILENRNFIYDQIMKIWIPAQPGGNQNQDAAIQRVAPLLGVVDIIWNHLKLAQVARKHSLPSLAHQHLEKAKNFLSKKPNSRVLTYESYKLAYEQCRFESQFKFNYDLSREGQNPPFSSDLQAKKLLSHALDERFSQEHRADFFRLLGDVHAESMEFQKAEKAYVEALNLRKKEPKTWQCFARLNAELFKYDDDASKLEHLKAAIQGFFMANSLALHKSKNFTIRIVRLLQSLSSMNLAVQKAQAEDFLNSVSQHIGDMAAWIWLFWLPQVIQLLFTENKKSKNNLVPEIALRILKRLAFVQLPDGSYKPSIYSQAVFHALDPFLSRQNQSPKFKQFRNDLIASYNFSTLNMRSQLIEDIQPNPLKVIIKLGEELQKGICKNIQQDVYELIQVYYDRASGETLENGLALLVKELENLFQSRQQEIQEDHILSNMMPFFMEIRTMSGNLLVQKMKIFKDFLQRQLSTQVFQQSLVNYSEYLADFLEKGIEMPGQYVTLEGEPLPENKIFIYRFKEVISKTGICGRLFNVKGANSKILSFKCQKLEGMEENFFGQQTVMQFKHMMNLICFRNFKETIRRGVKLFSPLRTSFGGTIWSQDDQPFMKSSEAYEFLLQEQGVDIDEALMMAYNMRGVPQHERNKKIFEQMALNNCLPTSFTSFCHRIYYNIDDMYIFKKQFTIHYSAGSFLTYLLSQWKNQNLQQIQFCKNSGRVHFNENSLFQDISKGEEENSLPFRLTPNFQTFIGQTGTMGLVPAVLTACALSLKKKEKLFIPMLELFYTSERQFFAQDESDAELTCQVLFDKAQALCSNETEIIYPHEEGKEEALQRPKFLQEFNKQVFELIEQACSKEKLAKQEQGYAAWF